MGKLQAVISIKSTPPILQKAALRIILKVPPQGHVTIYFKELRIMPVEYFNSFSQSQF
mgnify:CR=1 FL=1